MTRTNFATNTTLTPAQNFNNSTFFTTQHQANGTSKVWKTAAYIRLSQEDKDTRYDENSISNSVINQQQIVDEFIKSNLELGEYQTFIDDGLSGTTFDRKGFQDMFREIQLGNINCVVVKDLSRFGRNYAEAGMYIEQIFPTLGIRFIAINDYIDSHLRPNEMNSILIPLKNVLNDSYSRDLSVKVKSGMTAIRKRGEFIGAIAPYGYRIDPENKYKLLIDEEVAPIVQNIYKWYNEGLGKVAIVQKLNNMKILSPAKHRISKYPPNKKHSKSYAKNIAGLWCVSNITKILESPTYCGNLAQGKRTNVSYKSHKKVTLPKESWIVVENTHEPIISKENFERTQELCKIRTRSVPRTGETHLFSGILFCADCGKAMTRGTNRRKNGTNYVYYRCSTYYRMSKDLCTSHITPEKQLKTTIFEAIKMQIQLMLDVEKLMKSSSEMKNTVSQKTFKEKQLAKLLNEIETAEKLKIGLYSDLKKDLIDEKEYLQLKNNYNEEIHSMNALANELQIELSKTKDGDVLHKEMISRFVEFADEELLTRELLTALVNKIYIYADKSVEIEFKFRDEFKELCETLEQQE